MRAFKFVVLWAGALVVVACDWILAFRPSRIKRTLAHLRRTDWREFSEAKAWLVERGYTLTHDKRYPNGALADLRKDGTSVAIENEGGIWSVSAGPPSEDSRLHLLDAWAKCLGAEMPNFKESPTEYFWDLRLQLRYLRTNLSSIECRCEPAHLQQTLHCLVEARRAIDASDLASR